jgi:ubiquinone/menaquinone biosynthesis C-methylase UbiE
MTQLPEERDVEAGRIAVVWRHPRTGREARIYGGRRLFGGKDVIDVGTGVGRLAFEIAPYARSLVGIDPSEEAIAVARERAERERIGNVDFRVDDARTLRGVRDGFDVAIFSWSL